MYVCMLHSRYWLILCKYYCTSTQLEELVATKSLLSAWLILPYYCHIHKIPITMGAHTCACHMGIDNITIFFCLQK